MKNPVKRPALLIFDGLPGVGKSSLAQSLSGKIEAVYLRIDTIEQAIRDGQGSKDQEIGPEGYYVGYRLAEDNLKNGLSVVADSANTIQITRDAWLDVGRSTNAGSYQIEVICSDKEEHRNRVETRKPSIKGLIQPSWDEVCVRKYETWDGADIRIETAGSSPEKSLEELFRALSKCGFS